jgi:hypothetical protein
MALLYVAEFSEIVARGGVLIALFPALVVQSPIPIGGSSQQSQPFNSATAFIRMETDSICSFRIERNPVATTNDCRMFANVTEYVGVNPGDRVAVIVNI